MVVSTVSSNLSLSRSIFESRAQISDLQRQLASGRKITTYSDLGVDRTQVLALRQELTANQGYQVNIQQTSIRLNVISTVLERVRELTVETKTDALVGGFEPLSDGRTLYQHQSESRLDEMVALLNTEAAGRHFFGGRQVEQDPVVSVDQMLNGSGAKAGFKQVVSERRQADVGALGQGRLVLTSPTAATMLGGVVATPGDIGGVATAQVTIDIGGNPQTFDISDGGIDTLAGLEAAIDAAFGADVASIVGGNQLQLDPTNAADAITITDVDPGAAALAGLTDGAVANPSNDVDIAEDVVGNVFGFKISAATSNLTGTTLTGPAGAPTAVNVQFTAALPLDGETFTLTLDLPDGTTTDITLTARDNGTSPLEKGEFEIGTNAGETTVNFDTLVKSAIQTEALTTLSAASLNVASDNFFDFDAATPPQRVDGPPFDTAVALQDATTADTVFWYQGEVSNTPARESSVAKVSDTSTVGYGVRANEDAFRETFKSLAALTVETFSPGDVTAADRYTEIVNRTRSPLDFAGGAQSPDDVIVDITMAQVSIGRTQELHKAQENVLDTYIGERENSDIYEVASALLALQSRVEASLQVTASLSQISLLNFF